MERIKFKNIGQIKFQKVTIQIIKIKRFRKLNRIRNNIQSKNRDNKKIEF